MPGAPSPPSDGVQDVAREYERALHLMDVGWAWAPAAAALRRLLDRLPPDGTSPVPAARIRLSLAHAVAEGGHVSEGLALLDDLLADPGHDLHALALSQRGLLHLRSGRLDAALQDLDAAQPGLDPDDLASVRLTMNRGVVHLLAGRLDAAERDFAHCQGLAERLGHPVHAARAGHNLGYLRWLAGDLPRALAEMDRAHARQPDDSPGGTAVYRLDRARVLSSAGLLDEADADLERAAEAFAALGSPQDHADCVLMRAGIALTRGRLDDARALATLAARGFDRRGSRSSALLARLTRARARVAAGPVTARLVDEVDAVAAELAGRGLREDAVLARLVAARARLARGHTAQARAVLPRLRPADPLPVRLYAREVAADVAVQEGRPRAALAQRRAGLEELQRHQASFGSLDLQTAVTRHAGALAAGGLGQAVERGRPAEVLEWSERARSAASRLLPLRPPPDAEAAALLGELRYVRTEQRARELAGEDDAQLRARRVALEARIRARAWYAAGAAGAEQPVALDALRAELAATGGGPSALVAHLVVGPRLVALVVGGRSAGVLDLGAAGDVLERVRRVRADLDALALRGVPDPLRRSMSASLARDLELLDARLWRPVADRVRDDAVVIVPSGDLVGVPWGALPGLSGRPVSVPRSATAWVRGRSRARPVATAAFAAGPDLQHGGPEVEAAAALWPAASVATGGAATVGAVLAALDGSDLVHIAAHGVHEGENPLFSSLRLADGPLFGHDLDAVRTPAHHVVLSACDLGLATRRAGDELLGMTAALLHAGTTCVLASVARVADEVSAEVLVEYHRRLRAGDVPATALAAATGGRRDAPFVCFGTAS